MVCALVTWKRFCQCLLIALMVSAAAMMVEDFRRPHNSTKITVSAGQAANKAGVVANLVRLPLSFEANHGQVDGAVQYLSRAQGYTLYFASDEAVIEAGLSMAKADRLGPASAQRWTRGPEPGAQNAASTLPDSIVRMRLVGANRNSRATGADELPGKVNYFIGNDARQWRTNVPTYAKVKFQNVYPGVDLVYHGSQTGQLEYDFIVAAGANPDVIALALDAGGQGRTSRVGGGRSEIQSASPRIDRDGNLMVPTAAADLCFRKPVVYQEELIADSSQLTVRDGNPNLKSGNLKFENRLPAIDNRQLPTDNPKSKFQNRKFLEGHYVLTAANRIRFEVGEYDHTRPLIIDPVFAYSTYVGGNGNDLGYNIAVDSAGAAFVAGFTSSTNFPGTAQGYQSMNRGYSDAFVLKLDASGQGLVYATYLGGSLGEGAQAIAVDSAGQVFVAGYTQSSNFPVLSAFQNTNHGGATDGWVAKLNATGSSLLYSSYLGGSLTDTITGIAVDKSSNAFVTGWTQSEDFPVVNAYQSTYLNSGTRAPDAFVARINAEGPTLVYSTYLGGVGFTQGFGIAVDGSGQAYVTGTTGAADFPTLNPFQATLHGYMNAFITKFKAEGNGLIFSTFLGGSENDAGNAIALDTSGSIFIAGTTRSTDFPLRNPAQSTCGGCASGYYDSFVTRLNSAASDLVYSTFLGGSDSDYAYSIAVDSKGEAVVAGTTSSIDFPVFKALQPTCPACANYYSSAFVTRYDATGANYNYSTYLGGSDNNSTYTYGYGVAVDSKDDAYVTGSTASTSFPTVNAYQSSLAGGGADAFVAKITRSPDLSFSPDHIEFSPQTVGTSSGVKIITVSNHSHIPVTLQSVTVSAHFLDIDNCGSSLAVNTDCSVWVIFTPTTAGTLNGAITFTDDANGSPQVIRLTGTGTK